MGFKFDGIKRTWTDTKTTGDSLQSYTTTTTSGEPIEIKAPEWKIGDKIEINSPITVEPITYGWICPKCGRVNSPYTTSCDCQKFTVRTIEWEPGIPPACVNCSNHPSNGGSGICHCILGSPGVTY